MSIENLIKGFNYGSISFDKSLLRAVNNTVVLAEQIKEKKNAEMSYCISQFDITRLNMSHQTQTQVDFDIHIKIFLTIQGTTNNPPFLVQELAGTAKTVTPFYHLYYDNTPRPDGLVRLPWNQLQGQFDHIFTTVPNQEADGNRKKVEEELEEFFADQQGVMYSSILSSTEAQKREIGLLKTELLALTEIGLNVNHAAVRWWLKKVSDPVIIPSIEDMVGAVILRGQPIEQVKQWGVGATSTLKNAIGRLGGYNDLAPATDAISDRLSDLRKIVALRATLASR